VSTSPKHLTHFEGGNALSAFRAQALLPRLQAVSAAHQSAVSARHVHWVWSDAAAGWLASAGQARRAAAPTAIRTLHRKVRAR
jgi:hypothetical protein